jgi:hypothetical protein
MSVAFSKKKGLIFVLWVRVSFVFDMSCNDSGYPFKRGYQNFQILSFISHFPYDNQTSIHSPIPVERLTYILCMKTYCHNEYGWNTAYLKSINHTIMSVAFSKKKGLIFVLWVRVSFVFDMSCNDSGYPFKRGYTHRRETRSNIFFLRFPCSWWCMFPF